MTIQKKLFQFYIAIICSNFFCVRAIALESSNLSEKLKEFNSPMVLNYAEEMLQSIPSQQFIIPPKEFSDLVSIGEEAVPHLIPLLSENDEKISYASFLALQEITNKNFGKDALRENPNQETKKNIESEWLEWWKENKKKSRLQWLVDDLTNDDKFIRGNAAIKLAELKDKSSILPLRKALNDPSIVPWPAKALSEMGDAYVVPALIEYLGNDDQLVRITAIRCLKKMTGETFSYESSSKKETREKSVEKWEKWWEKNKEKYPVNN